MTYYCSECVVNWHPFQCPGGACPDCGGGTKRSNDPASPDAGTLHRITSDAAIKRDRYARFEAYYAEREQQPPFAA